MERACVYVVDDDPTVRESTTFLLRSHSLDCRAFANGKEFLDAVDRLDPGCILLDMRMPLRSGLEVQAELAQRHNIFPVIAMTGTGSNETTSRSREMGAIDVLEKPFADEELMDALGLGFEMLDRLDVDEESRPSLA